MIKDLVGQIQQQKKEGSELVQQNYELTDKVLKLEQLCLQIKMEYNVDFQELDAML